jgi:CheY-like chemotaxis protein
MSKVVLLVEDNPTDEKLMLHAFGKWNLANEIAAARDGVEALEYLQGAGCEGRPRIDGLEVLRRIRAHERTRVLPVVILTSSREEEDLVRSYSLGANAYVRKPIHFAEFVEAARTLGLFWLVLNEPPPTRRGGA